MESSISKMTDVPRSKEFDDIYFSVQDGLAETRHVFLDGNDLPDSWLGHDEFTICETGFGTGLNFLAVLKLWQDSPKNQRPKKLHFISFEKYPLTQDYIQDALSCWDKLSEQLACFLFVYPFDISEGVYNFTVIDGVELMLVFGDVNGQIPQLDKPVNCWFLDGFKPSSNPDMWSDIVFTNMARLSVLGATFATFTAAGFVRRALVTKRFDVRKISGFGHKREMCVGSYQGDL